MQFAPVAQLDSASVYGTEGYRFESYREYLVQRFVPVLVPSPGRTAWRARFFLWPADALLLELWPHNYRQ